MSRDPIVRYCQGIMEDDRKKAARRNILKRIYQTAKKGRRRAAGHNCDGTAACQAIVDLIDNSFNEIATSPDQDE